MDGGSGNRHAGSVDESRQWAEFGKWLAEQREQKGLRRRDAAKRAQVPEGLWRDLETGRKEAIGGIRLLPNPSQDVLERVAGVLEVPVDEVLARIGRPSPSVRRLTLQALNGRDAGEEPLTLEAKLRRLTPRDRALVEHLVDGMLTVEDD